MLGSIRMFSSSSVSGMLWWSISALAVCITRCLVPRVPMPSILLSSAVRLGETRSTRLLDAASSAV